MSERNMHEWYIDEPGNYICRHCGARAVMGDKGIEADKQQCIWSDVYKAIARERNYQKHKWGNNPHAVGEWLLIMQAELDEAKQAWVENQGDNAALEEILQVVSVGVACMEQHTPENDQDSEFKKLVEAGESKNQASLKAYGRIYAGNIVARGKRVLGEI